MRTRDCSFGAAISEQYPPVLCDVLTRWVVRFASDDFLEDASSEGVGAKWAAYDVVLDHVDMFEDRVVEVVGELTALDG